MSTEQILLGLTMGDPAGIGPEIAVKALTSKELPSDAGVFVIGDAEVLRNAARIVGSTAPVKVLGAPDADSLEEGCINVLDLHQIDTSSFAIGAISADCGKAAYNYILKAIELAKGGVIDGVVTNPINKEALRMAGVAFPGHTEIFAAETGAQNYSMMFYLEKVAVVHVTTHVSLRQAIELVTPDRVYATIRLAHQALVAMGVSRPRLAVGGLNPHAGEHGLFGDEEEKHIAPAVGRAQSEGLLVVGPLPPDSVFMRAFRGEFDGVVAMLHDHGFVALKSRDFDKGVNITIGLPIVRTSVGHGTAFNIAGTGKASESSLLEAIRLATRLAKNKLAASRT